MGDDELKAGIEELIKAANLNLCLECGRCSAICPMLEFYGEFVFNRSPRAVVERLLFDPDDIYDESLWYCLNCQKCTAFCPNGIDFQGFMTGLRELLLSHGHKKHAHFCTTCGQYMMPKKEFECLLKKKDGEKLGHLLSMCHRCKQNDYAEVLYRTAHWPKRRIRGRPGAEKTAAVS